MTSSKQDTHKPFSLKDLLLPPHDNNLTQHYNALSHVIIQHDELYYKHNRSDITDAEYDALRQALEKLEKQYPHLKTVKSPTQRVGFEQDTKFTKVIHEVPMLSLAKALDAKEMNEFMKGLTRILALELDDFIPIFAEPKIDGVSASLLYEKGQLIRGASRGNGLEGENITENLLTISTIPHHINAKNLPEKCEIRGEVFFSHEAFSLVNEQQKQNNKPLFANPRNAAAGSLRTLNVDITASRPLQFFAYDFLDHTQSQHPNQNDLPSLLASYGFMVQPDTCLCHNFNEAHDFFRMINTKRSQLGYDIDGIVYKVNEHIYQHRLGTLSRYPRYAVAWKFVSETASTTVEAIDIQVGRTGQLTPVARLKPVLVGGVMVTNASLHNEEDIARKDIRVGAKVIIKRAGDVIPQIESVITDAPHNHLPIYVFPDHCPICQSSAIKPYNERLKQAYAERFCSAGLSCKAQKLETLVYLVSKTALDIQGFSKNHIAFLIDKEWIKKPADIFTLQKRNSESLTKIEHFHGWGTLSTQNLFNAIERARQVSLEKFIIALGIRHIGEKNAKIIARHFHTYTHFLNAIHDILDNPQGKTAHNFISNDSLGNASLESLITYFRDTTRLENMIDLAKQLHIIDWQDTHSDSILNNKTIVFTGTLTSISRKEAKIQAERLGAKVTNSVSKQTDYVIIGDNAGKKKQMALDFRLSILTEEQWLNMLASL